MAGALSGIYVILLIAFVLVNVIAVVGGVVWTICKALKMKDKKGFRAIILSMLCILVAACAWIFNFGWLRLVLTVMLVPFIHAIIFFITNTCASKYMDKSKKMKVCIWLFYITYILAYIMLPDCDDVKTYMFFGLIRDDMTEQSITGIGFLVSNISCLIHIIVFVLQIVEIRRIKKEEKAEALNETTETESGL